MTVLGGIHRGDTARGRECTGKSAESCDGGSNINRGVGAGEKGLVRGKLLGGALGALAIECGAHDTDGVVEDEDVGETYMTMC